MSFKGGLKMNIVSGMVCKKIAVGVGKKAVATSAKIVTKVSCEVATYYAVQKIIKKVNKKKNFKPVNTCTVKLQRA